MANEFKIKNGLIVSGSTEIEQNLTVHGTLTAQIEITGTTGYSTFSGSISSSIGSLSSSIASTDYAQNVRLDNLESQSGSIRTDFNSFTSSYTTVSSSLDSRLDVLEAYSGSQQVPTASYSLRTTQTDVYCKNMSGVQIDKGTVVRISGAVGDNPLIGVASLLTEGQSANTLGIAAENIPNDSFGLVITEGVLIGVNTSGMTAGQLIFLGANGTFTTSYPVAPNHGVRLGEVLRDQQNQGSIYVRIDNGSELGEAHDVYDTTTNSSYGDLLVKSGSVWINSKKLNGDYEVTGSLTITQNLNVLGSSSLVYVTSSQLAVSSSTISVNVFEPAERFGGLKVYDSGSSNATASLLWDSLNNHWIYQNASGSNYSGGMLLSGPRNTGSLGDESGLTSGKIVKSVGGDHLDNSIMSETGTTVTVSGDLVANSITGAFDFFGLVNRPTLVSGSSQIDVMSTTNIARLATTGSNIFVGTQTISGSILPSVDNTYDLGSPTHQFRDLYLSSASLYIDGTKVIGSTAQELQITTDVGQSFKILEAGSDTITLQSADGNITLTSSGGGDVIMDPTTGIIALKGTTTLYSGNKIVSSDGNSIQFGNGIAITGSIISTVTPLVSGSSQISFTGLSNVPSGIVSGSSQVLSGTGIWSGSAQLPSGTVSGSAQITLSSTTGYGSILNQAVLTTSSPTFSGIYVNQTSATNSPTATIRQTTAGGNGNQDIGLVVDIQGANDLDRILNLRYYNGSTYTSRFSVLRDGKVGIGSINPVAGMYLAQYGTNWDDDSQYSKPSGNVFLSMGYSVSDAHNWFGIRGNYGSSSGTANLLLQANYRDIGSQAGHYLTSTATGLGTSYFAIGKLETTTSTSTPPNKIEQLIITRAGTLQIKPNTIGTSDTSDRSVIIGSRPSNSSIASLGFDTGGTYRGDFDFSSGDGNLSWWSYNGSSWTEKWRSTPSSGFNIYNSALSLTETGVSSFSISYSSGKTQFGMDSAGTDGFYFRSYSSGAYADRFIIKSSGEVNVRGTILPVSDATYNLGSTSLRWNNLYTTDLHLSNEGKQNVVDGTWGDWTLQEGENDIFMLNNRSEEKFKIKLEKITE